MKNQRTLISAAVAAAALMLAGCGDRKDDRAAFAVCLADAKKDVKIANASFVEFEKANIQASTGDSGIRVNIPYELDGKKGLFQCIADKQPDGTYRVVP